MNDAIATSVLPNILPAAVVDTMYPGETNCAKAAANIVVDNRYVQDFASLNGGASTFIVSPASGVSDMVCYFKYGTQADVTGYGLPQSWGYSLIKTVQIRYANSTTYIFNGEQIYLQNLHEAEDGTKRDQLAILGGNALIGNACSGAEAYVYINLPHNTPRSAGKSLPLPTDLFVQPCQIVIELNQPASIFVDTGSGTGSPISALAKGQFQVKQECFTNSANLLANRVDMNEMSLTYPLKYFPQQEQTFQLANSPNVQTISLTGFRSGMVKSLLLWLTKTSEVEDNGSHYYSPMSDVILTYNGLQLYRADSQANQLWSIIEDTKSAVVNTYEQSAGAWVSAVVPWVHIPMGQTNTPYDREYKLMGGRAILNAVLNLSLKTPTAAADYVLHMVPLYDAALSISRGGAEYVF